MQPAKSTLRPIDHLKATVMAHELIRTSHLHVQRLKKLKSQGMEGRGKPVWAADPCLGHPPPRPNVRSNNRCTEQLWFLPNLSGEREGRHIYCQVERARLASSKVQKLRGLSLQKHNRSKDGAPTNGICKVPKCRTYTQPSINVWLTKSDTPSVLSEDSLFESRHPDFAWHCMCIMNGPLPAQRRDTHD
eukprot:754678-Pelagomonas_calceolata.AAC.8